MLVGGGVNQDQDLEDTQVGHIAKLSFNFNLILVESWDGIILNSSTPPTQPPTQSAMKK